MSAPLRCLVVDDEALAREALRTLVALDPGLTLAGEARDGHDALARLENDPPDLVFLDVQMPEMGGFEVIAQAAARGVPLPAVIFVTAYDRYALRAFEVHAFDYLLKPVRESRFREAIAETRRRLAADRFGEESERLAALLSGLGLTSLGLTGSGLTGSGLAGHDLGPPRPRRLAIKVDGCITFVDPAELEWLEPEGNYVRLHLGTRTALVRETLTDMEARLDPARFMRIHRSAIVNIDRIRDLRPWFTGEYIVRMEGGREFTLTRRYRDNLRRLIGRQPIGDEPRAAAPIPRPDEQPRRRGTRPLPLPTSDRPR